MKRINSEQIEQFEKINKVFSLLKLDYLFGIPEQLVSNVKIIGDATDLEVIHKRTFNANRYLQTILADCLYYFNEIKAEKNSEMLLIYKRLFPDTFDFVQKEISENDFKNHIIDLFLRQEYHLFNYREPDIPVYDLIKKMIDFKNDMGLTNNFVQFSEIQQKTTLCDEGLRSELKRLCKLKKLSFKQINNDFYFTTNE